MSNSLTSRQFNQFASEAKRAAANGPVFITDRGKPAHVLLTIADYQRLTAHQPSIAELLAMPAEHAHVDLPEVRLQGTAKPVDLGI